MLPIALQLYSVRDHLERDVRETLDKVKAAGYDRVEPFGLDPDAAAEWMALLGAAGLQAVASHVDYELVRDDPDRAAEMAKIIGYEDLVVPWVMVDTAEEWVHVAGVLDEAGARLRAQGLRLGYHNHDHEFEPIGDTTPFDILFEYAAPENLFLELDVRWAGEHGGDPVARNSDRAAGSCISRRSPQAASASPKSVVACWIGMRLSPRAARPGFRRTSSSRTRAGRIRLKALG